MSNKSTFQEKNSRLLANNNDLASILNTINNLPSSSDGTTEDAFIENTVSGNYTNDRITTVGYGCFYNNKNITGIDFPNVESVGSYAFFSCSNLTQLNLPKLTTCSVYSFYYIAVENLYLPELTTMDSWSIGASTRIKTITLPKLTKIPNGGLRKNTGCTTVDLGACTSIQDNALHTNSSLTTLIIRTPSVCSLAAATALTSTPIANGTGYVYVPDDLVNSYKTATNWSTYAAQIKGLSELDG